MRRWLAILVPLLLFGCGGYRDFSLPSLPGSGASISVRWEARSSPVLSTGKPGEWDSVDVLNPSVIKTADGYLNLYSGFDGKLWRTGVATSPDGIAWTKRGPILSPREYIAANGSVLKFRGSLLYYYQSGRTPRIELAREVSLVNWTIRAPTGLNPGPYGSWDERGVADPYVIEIGGRLYLYYIGLDRARRQRLGVATSADGILWSKLVSNPILELAEYGEFDENGVGEPAVWAARGFYWLLYTGRAHSEQRRLGLARSTDGVHWDKLPSVIKGDQPWNFQVLCDPTVLVEGDKVRVWFGGGDVPRPDENIHGQIGYAVLSLNTSLHTR